MIDHINYNNASLKLLSFAAAGVALWLSSATPALADYYRWTDENGVVHMTDKRPEEVDVEVIKPKAPIPRTFEQQAADAAAAEAEALAEAEAEANAPQAVDPNAPKDLRCQQERERLGILQNNSVVHMQDANGNLKKLSESEIQQEIAVTQKAIDALCK